MDEPPRGRFRKLLGGGRKKSKAPVAEDDSPVVDDVEDPAEVEPELDLFAEPEPVEAPEPVVEPEVDETEAVEPDPVEERQAAKHAKVESKKNRWVVIAAAVVAIAAIAGGVIFWAVTARNNNDDSATPARVSLLPARPTTSAPPQETGDVVVRVAGSFSPSSVTIKAGQTVTWIFDDGGKKHAVQGLKDIGQIINGPVMIEGKYTVLFDRPGTFEYIDSLFPDSRGKVIVEK